MDTIQLLANDKSLVTYRPRLNKITGSVTATILLLQILYWWTKQRRKKFYKFMSPCQHSLYRIGDSWEEELGFTRRELTTALKKLGTKLTKGTSKTEALKDKLIIYWTDSNRMTWFEVNEPLLRKKLSLLYNGANVHYIDNEQKSHYIETDESAITLLQETTPKTTTETTQKKPPRDFIDDVHQQPPDLDKQLFGEAKDRPSGWRAMDTDTYNVCRRVAKHWTAGILPGENKAIERWQAGAFELLRIHDSDLQATLVTLDKYELEYNDTGAGFTVTGPQSLTNVIPAFIGRRQKTTTRASPQDPNIDSLRDLGKLERAVENGSNDDSNGKGDNLGTTEPKGTFDGPG